MRRDGGGLDEVLDLVAHDLRNPLSALTTGVEVLRRRADLSSDALRTVERLRSSTERMTVMIDQLDEWARAQLAGGVAIDRGPADLHELARSLVEELEKAAAARVRLALDGDGRGQWDATRLMQALATLVGNALDHGDPGAPVELRVAGDGKAARVEVSNGGPSIARELAPILFDPVARRRVQRPSKARGLGFGLWLARAVVVAHGGSLDVRSSENHTIFILTLPR